MRIRLKPFWGRLAMRRVFILPLGLLLAVAIVIVTLGDSESVEVEIEAAAQVRTHSTDALRFVVLGDTGGLPLMHETRAQKKVAARLAELAREKGLDAIVGVGDNIYFNGVTDEYDSRFESSFEVPYMSPALDLPFYMIAGNHDHFGNITGQVEYTKHSRKWKYPSLYYNFTMKAPDGTEAEFIMLDTIVLCGNTKDIENSGFWRMLFSKSTEPDGPHNVTAAEEQWRWLEERLAASRAPYLFVVGHYPVHSVSSHGPTKCMAERVTPMMHKYNVTAYFAGHDHTLQHISYPSDNGNTMHYIVSGAGSRTDPSTRHWDTVQAPGTIHFHFPSSGTIIKQLGVSDGGYIVAELTADLVRLRFQDAKANQLYTTSLRPRWETVEN